jgi:hypothetical protein
MSAPRRVPAQPLDPARLLRLDALIRELRETIERGPERVEDPQLRSA